jgi:hypothetical protein
MVAAMSSLASEAAQLARLSPRQREVLEARPGRVPRHDGWRSSSA